MSEYVKYIPKEKNTKRYYSTDLPLFFFKDDSYGIVVVNRDSPFTDDKFLFVSSNGSVQAGFIDNDLNKLIAQIIDEFHYRLSKVEVIEVRDNDDLPYPQKDFVIPCNVER